jgi:hypothetical protein
VKTWRKCKFIYNQSIKEVNKIYEKEKISIEKEEIKIQNEAKKIQNEAKKIFEKKKNFEKKIEIQIEKKLMEKLEEKDIKYTEFLQFKIDYWENKNNQFDPDLEKKIKENENYYFFMSLIE